VLIDPSLFGGLSKLIFPVAHPGEVGGLDGPAKGKLEASSKETTTVGELGLPGIFITGALVVVGLAAGGMR